MERAQVVWIAQAEGGGRLDSSFVPLVRGELRNGDLCCHLPWPLSPVACSRGDAPISS